MRKNLFFLIIAAIWLCTWWYWPAANYYLGNFHLNNYRYSNAIMAYTRAIKSNRSNDERLGKSYFGRGLSKLDFAYVRHAADEEVIEALADFNHAIELIPDDPYYYRERGTAYSYLGAYEEAFRDFELLGRLEGEKPLWSLVRKGGLERRLGHYDDAIETLETVIDLWAPNSVMPPNYHLALTYLELKQYQKAVDAINEGEKHQTDYGHAYKVRACAKANLSLYQDALDDFQSGISINQTYFNKTEAAYPYAIHDAKVEEEELNYLRMLANGKINPERERLESLCMRNWWRIYYDIERERSSLLSGNT